MKSLTRIHEWLSAGARANDISDDDALKIAEEACIAIQDGTLPCWDENSMPIRGGLPIPKQPAVGPYITDEVGNDWLKSKGYFWNWKHVSEPVSQSQFGLSAKVQEPWIAKAKQRAREIIEAKNKLSLYPDQASIADQIARDFREAGIHGKSGKPLTGAYIKRHALKGIDSGKPPRKHAEIARGK